MTKNEVLEKTRERRNSSTLKHGGEINPTVKKKKKDSAVFPGHLKTENHFARSLAPNIPTMAQNAHTPDLSASQAGIRLAP